MKSRINRNWLIKALVSFATLFVIAVLAFILFISPFTQNYRRIRYFKRHKCVSNVKQFGLSLKQYAIDHEGFFPAENNAKGLNKLYELDYLTDYNVYACPYTKTLKGTSGPIAESNCDYIYLGGFKELENPNTPLVFDKPGNHKDHINVLFLDGHVMGYDAVGLTNCESVISFLQGKNKYSPKLFKKLSDKAKRIDKALSKK